MMWKGGDWPIQLWVKEYQLLSYLINQPNWVRQRQEIMTGICGENFFGDDNLLDIYIRYLRRLSNPGFCLCRTFALRRLRPCSTPVWLRGTTGLTPLLVSLGFRGFDPVA